MSSTGENSSKAGADREEKPESGRPAAARKGPVIDVRPASIPPMVRRWLLVAVAVIVVLALAVGSYPYWRNSAGSALAVVGIDVEVLELYLGVPSWLTDLGRPDTEGAGEEDRPESAPTADTAARPAAEGVRDSTRAQEEPDPEGAEPARDPALQETSGQTVPGSPAGSGPGPAPVTTAPVTTAPADPAVRDQVERLRDQATALSDRVTALEERLALAEAALTRDSSPAAAGDPDLEQRITALEEGLVQLGDAVQAPEPAAADLASVLPTLLQIAERVAAVESREQVRPQELAAVRAGADSVRDRVAALEERVGSLSMTLEEEEPERERTSLVLLALGHLRLAAAGPEPYRNRLETLRPLFAGDQDVEAALDELAAGADQGAPTLAALRREFPEVARRVLQTREEEVAEGLVGQTLARVATLVTVRRIEDVPEDSLEAALLRAESALADGDLAAAVSALDELKDAQAAAAAVWLEQAQRRLAVRRALASVEATVLARLGDG